MKINFLGLFVGSWQFWENNWRKLTLPIGLLLTATIWTELAQYLWHKVYYDSILYTSQPNELSNVVLLNILFGIAIGAVVAIFYFATLKPLWDLLHGRKAADVRQQLLKKWFIAVAIYICETIIAVAATMLVALPIAIFLAAGADKFQGMSTNTIAFGQFNIPAFALVVAIPGLLSYLAITSLLQFWKIEAAVAGRGVLDGLNSSYKIARGNYVYAFAFQVSWSIIYVLFWFIAGSLFRYINLEAGLLNSLPVPILTTLLLVPVEMASRLRLWEQIGGSEPKAQ